MDSKIGNGWSKYFKKTPAQSAASITISDDSPPVNLASDQSNTGARVHCWCHGSKVRWGSYKSGTGRKKAAGIIPLEFEIAETGGARLRAFELAITFGVSTQKDQHGIPATAANVASLTPSVYLVPGTRPWPRCVDDLFLLSKREWNLLFEPDVTIMDQGIKLGQASLPSAWTRGKRWSFESHSEAVNNYQCGTYWKYRVFDFDEAGANKYDWKGAVSVIHGGGPFNVVGHLTLKAYKKPYHFRNKKSIAQDFIFEPRTEDENVDLTAKIEMLAEEVEEAYQEMQKRKYLLFLIDECELF